MLAVSSLAGESRYNVTIQGSNTSPMGYSSPWGPGQSKDRDNLSRQDPLGMYSRICPPVSADTGMSKAGG